jgi:hypothetical protein
MTIKKVSFLILAFLFMVLPVQADISLGEKLAGRILLQVEENGEAWYVSPENKNKYYLGRPSDAFNIMRELGIGITNEDLNKIPLAILKNTDQDNDNDGLGNRLEDALLTNKDETDTDQDGHNDYDEIINNYNPLCEGKILTDEDFAQKNAGKIFLQVEQNGEAWYVNPTDVKRYYLARPGEAFEVMRQLGLGISNIDFEKIPKYIKPIIKPIIPSNPAKNIIGKAADAIRANDISEAEKYFHANIIKRLEYTLEALNNESRLLLGNALSGSTLDSETSDKLVYKNNIFFSLGGYSVPVVFNVEKNEDGNWYITNL